MMAVWSGADVASWETGTEKEERWDCDNSCWDRARTMLQADSAQAKTQQQTTGCQPNSCDPRQAEERNRYI